MMPAGERFSPAGIFDVLNRGICSAASIGEAAENAWFCRDFEYEQILSIFKTFSHN